MPLRKTGDLAFLRLLQIFDSQFPVGAFAHSGGLETYADAGLDLAGLRSLLMNEIELGWGRADLGAAVVAWREAGGARAGERLHALALRVEAYKVVPSVRDTSLRLGRRMVSLVSRLYPDLAMPELSRPHYAVVAGAVGRKLDLPRRDLALAFGQSLVMSSLAAATRCMRVSPAQAQALVVDLQPSIVRAVDRIPDGVEPDALFTCMPALDIRSHQQAFLHTRLFQS
jgi:urease accessory protein